ncbi:MULTISPECIES: response regulator [unclassified Phaeobacter]|uniref:response regulator n=1 Tax=unclassified Phaeobacter TaxID=2621772 RepID=UPI003A842E6B
MKQLKRHLPPLTSLLAFEAAARLGSFTAAAEELNVSREAVSRQIRTLESHLGISLFERDANRALMGAAGARFFATVSPNLTAIAVAAKELAGEVGNGPEPEDAALPENDEELPSVLVVDDTPQNIHHLHGLLRDAYRIVPQTSGKAALSFLAGESADLVLLDIRMPDMDGYEVCRRIKSTASLADTPVIFLTSLDDSMDETKGLEMGACDFITRPIVPAVLRARIRSHVELRQAKTALEKLLARRADRLGKAEQLLARMCADIGQFQSS